MRGETSSMSLDHHWLETHNAWDGCKSLGMTSMANVVVKKGKSSDFTSKKR
jgi:hypothetical protein